MLLTTYDSHGYQPAGQFERGGDGLLEARGDARLDEQAVDDHFDRVVLAFVDDREIVEREQLTVDAHADVAVLCEFFEFRIMILAPLRPRTMGARIMMRSSGLQISPCRMDCTICSLDWRVMGLPQFGQCGTPTAA